MTRTYKLKQRSIAQDQTRQKIIDAAIELHQAKGLVATTMSDIAVRAKVGRVTVYRHFPDEMALAGACSGQYFSDHPLPDFETWLSVTDFTERMRLGLHAAYAFFNSTQVMLTKVYPEARDLPIMEPYHAHWRGAADALLEALPLSEQNKVLTAAIGHALNFETWRSLVQDQGLGDDQAVELMIRLACNHPGKIK